MTMKMKLNIKIDHLDTTFRPRNGRKYAKYKMCFSILMVRS